MYLIGQPFSAPSDTNKSNDQSNPTISPETSNSPKIINCEDSVLLKELLINYVNNLKFGSIVTKNSRKMIDALDQRIKFLEQEKKNIGIEYTIKETDFKIKDEKAKQMQKLANIAKYLFLFLFSLLIFIFMF